MIRSLKWNTCKVCWCLHIAASQHSIHTDYGSFMGDWLTILVRPSWTTKTWHQTRWWILAYESGYWQYTRIVNLNFLDQTTDSELEWNCITDNKIRVHIVIKIEPLSANRQWTVTVVALWKFWSRYRQPAI